MSGKRECEKEKQHRQRVLMRGLTPLNEDQSFHPVLTEMRDRESERENKKGA